MVAPDLHRHLKIGQNPGTAVGSIRRSVDHGGGYRKLLHPTDLARSPEHLDDADGISEAIGGFFVSAKLNDPDPGFADDRFDEISGGVHKDPHRRYERGKGPDDLRRG